MKRYSILLSVALCAVFALLTSCEKQNPTPAPDPIDTRVDTLCLSARFYFCDDMDTYLTHKVTMSKDDGTPVLLNLTRVQKYDSTEERNDLITAANRAFHLDDIYYADALITVREPGKYTFKISYEKTGATGETLNFVLGSNVVSLTDVKKSKYKLGWSASSQTSIHKGVDVSQIDKFLQQIEKNTTSYVVVERH